MSKSFANPVIAAIVSVLLTTLIAVISFGYSLPSRTEVHSMIQNESPYLADRRLLMESMQRSEEKLDRLTREIEGLKVEQAKILARLERKGQGQ